MKGILYFIPAPLGENEVHTLPEYLKPIVFELKHFIVEQEKTARHYLKALGYPHPLLETKLYPLNHHTSEAEWAKYIEPLLQGISMGLISEAGCPGVADPGANIAALAHEKGIQVVPFVGPSSILLALMASGMNGQSFAFNGYLPIKDPERSASIQQFEQLSKRSHQTQIFIEAPYRNQQLLADLLKTLKPETRLCIAVDLTLKSEMIKTMSVQKWRQMTIELHKKPTVFLILA